MYVNGTRGSVCKAVPGVLDHDRFFHFQYRHFNNFGVLRDVKTLKFVDLAPIFDSGNSMLWNRRNIPTGEKMQQALLAIPVTSFKRTEVELLSKKVSGRPANENDGAIY